MFKTIQEIRSIPGFEALTKKQRANYIEYIHYILEEISVVESVQFVSVEPDPQNAPDHVLITLIRNGEKETYPSGCFL